MTLFHRAPGALIELGEAVLGVEEAVDVEFRSMLEPGAGLVGAAGQDQGIAVGVGQAGTGQACGVEGGVDPLKFNDRGIVLAQVVPGAGDDDGQLDDTVLVQLAEILGAGEVDGLLRAAEATFAVSHDGDETGATGHPAGGTQLRQRLLPLTGVIGGDTVGLPDHRDTPGPVLRGAGVAQSQLRIIGEPGGGHDHVLGHGIGVVLGQHPEILEHQRIEILDVDVAGQIGLIDPGVDPLLAEACPLRVQALALLAVTAGPVGVAALRTAATFLAGAVPTLTATGVTAALAGAAPSVVSSISPAIIATPVLAALIITIAPLTAVVAVIAGVAATRTVSVTVTVPGGPLTTAIPPLIIATFAPVFAASVITPIITGILPALAPVSAAGRAGSATILTAGTTVVAATVSGAVVVALTGAIVVVSHGDPSGYGNREFDCGTTKKECGSTVKYYSTIKPHSSCFTLKF